MHKFFALAASATVVFAPMARGQNQADTTRTRRILPAVVVTATRTPKSTFESPAPVSYLGSEAIREGMPNSPADLFRTVVGLDVNGVGTNQVRPSIRGQRGQRILLLEDGIRMNNSRRQQDFGELPALVGTADIDRVEVVRGPASVLYGTDAIAGVVNIITREVPRYDDRGLHGSASYLYGAADVQSRPSATLEQRLGPVAYRFSGTLRQSNPYSAPAGSYGKVTLPSRERVNDTGVDDESVSGLVSYDLGSHQQLLAKYERYTARGAGFGYVDPSVLGPDQPLIRIRYPDQRVGKYSLRYEANGLGTRFADRVSMTAYTVDNRRQLTMDIFIPFGEGTPPGAGLQSNSANYTKLTTLGFRTEATKSVDRHLLTYGVDAFRDRSENTDSSTTTVIGFGPPRPTTSTAPQVPNASFRSAGAFAQGDLRVGERLSVVIGGRVQDIEANTRPTSGASLSSNDRTAVGTANLLYRLGNGLNVVTSIGRGFRSPNLVERFFDGPAPEGSGYQKSNPDLRAETSVNLDVGLRYRRGLVALEGFAFRNDVRDGIRIAPTGDSVNRQPAFKNVNVDRLRFSGLELDGSAFVGRYFFTRASYTRLTSRNVLDPNNPIGTSYSTKTVGELTYRQPSGRFSVGYLVRRNGRQSEQQIGTNPVGTELPAFTVHALRGGVEVFDRNGMRGSLRLAVENLANTLYAESSNVGFFRPQPGRNVLVSWAVDF
jgi:outer membrane receptor protein involved in Fe transport